MREGMRGEEGASEFASEGGRERGSSQRERGELGHSRERLATQQRILSRQPEVGNSRAHVELLDHIQIGEALWDDVKPYGGALG